MISRGCVFDDYSHSPILRNSLQGKHTDRRNWLCPLSRLWSAYDHFRPGKLSILKLVHTGWHSPMDEPRAYRPAGVRTQGQSPNELVGLLFSWNGHIRDYQWEPPIPRTQRHNCFREGIKRRASPPRGGVHGGSVEAVGDVLGVSTEQPPKHQRCSSLFEYGLSSAIDTQFRGERRSGEGWW